MERIKIGLDYASASQLVNDAETFGFLKRDGSVNLNLFLNTLLAHLYTESSRRSSSIKDLLHETLKSSPVDAATIDQLSLSIDNIIFHGVFTQTKATLSYPLSFRPTRDKEKMFSQIEARELRDRTMANYLRSLLTDYLKLAQAERECVIFLPTVNQIEEAFHSGRKVQIKLGANLVQMRPYLLLENEERTFMYLYGDISAEKRTLVPEAFHLYKIADHLAIGSDYCDFTDKEKQYLDKAIATGGPQYIAENPITASFQLDDYGLKMLRSVYYNRPKILALNEVEKTVVVAGSKNHLFQYFFRFGEHAVALSPETLKKSLLSAFEKASKAYTKPAK